jgi:F0F1-type ATP synthase assembly protein I
MNENSERFSGHPTDESKQPAAIRGRNKAMREFSRYHTFAVEIAIAIIAPTLAGHWLDSRTGKEPWFLIGGLVLGTAAAVRSVQRVYGESQRALNKAEEQSDPESSE